MAQEKARCSTAFRGKLQAARICETYAIQHRHHRARLRASERFHHRPCEILGSPYEDEKKLIQPYLVRKKTQRMQGTIGRYINDVALISGDARRENRGKSQSAGKACAFHLMNAPRRQAAVGHPAIHCIRDGNGARKTPLRFFEAANPLT